jgi:hypothetical protein
VIIDESIQTGTFLTQKGQFPSGFGIVQSKISTKMAGFHIAQYELGCFKKQLEGRMNTRLTLKK